MKRRGLCMVVVLCLSVTLWAGVSSGAIPIIFDDDGSPDAVIALMYLLRLEESGVVQLRALTICQGEAHPAVYAEKLCALLKRVGREDIPVAYGSEHPLVGFNCFPSCWRAWSDAFWCLALPSAHKAPLLTPAYQLITDTLRAATQPVTILATGSLTNVALALRSTDVVARGHIREIVIMGGAWNVPGNIRADAGPIDNVPPCGPYTNATAEFNFWADPVAASEVFHSGLSIRVVPLDATNTVRWTQEDARRWISSSGKAGTEEGRIAGRLLLNMMEFYEDYYAGSPFTSLWVYDLLAAVVVAHPEFSSPQFGWTKLAIDVVTAAGGVYMCEDGTAIQAEQGQSVACCAASCRGGRTQVLLSISAEGIESMREAVDVALDP